MKVDNLEQVKMYSAELKNIDKQIIELENFVEKKMVFKMTQYDDKSEIYSKIAALALKEFQKHRKKIIAEIKKL